MKKEILITGGAGYIGSHAVKLFLHKGYEVAVFDNLSRGYLEPIRILGNLGKVSFVKGDLKNKKDIQKVFSQHKIDSVIHFAGLCLVNESMSMPKLYFANNVLGTFNLLEAMRETETKKIIFSSTCATYGETQYLPVDEKHPQNPTNPYGESKLMAEKMIRWYEKSYDFNYVILRYFNVCGADKDGLIGDGKKPSPHLVQNVVRGAMGIEPFSYTCPKVKTPDGTPIRDYIDVEDLVEAHYLAHKYLEDGGKSDIFNLGNGKGYSVKEIVSQVEKNFSIIIPKEKGETRKGEYARIYANPKKVRKVLKWKPKKDLEESISSLRKWYEKYPRGYEK